MAKSTNTGVYVSKHGGFSVETGEQTLRIKQNGDKMEFVMEKMLFYVSLKVEDVPLKRSMKCGQVKCNALT